MSDFSRLSLHTGHFRSRPFRRETSGLTQSSDSGHRLHHSGTRGTTPLASLQPSRHIMQCGAHPTHESTHNTDTLRDSPDADRLSTPASSRIDPRKSLLSGSTCHNSRHLRSVGLTGARRWPCRLWVSRASTSHEKRGDWPMATPQHRLPQSATPRSAMATRAETCLHLRL